jgi:uncharacterized protein YbjT (DUF2867 family)
VLGSGRQRTAPIHVDDLAHLLAAAATDLTTPTGVVEVGGPTVLDLDELVRRLNPPDVTVRHIPAGIARLLGRLVPDLNPALVDLQLRDSVPATDPRDVAAQFGVRLREVVPLVPEAAPAR